MATELRRGAFDAGQLAVAATSLYALLLVLLRTDGPEQAVGATVCVLLLAALGTVRLDPGAAYALMRRRPGRVAVAVGALLGVGLALAGTGGSLLFLPAVLLLTTIGTVVPVRTVAIAAALAAAGQLCVLLEDGPTAGEQRLALVAALGVAAIPVALAAVMARVARRVSAPATPATSTVLDRGSDAPTIQDGGRVGAVLTPRQLEAVALARAGLRHGEIAQELGVSVHQVRRLLRQARERTGASTTRELVAWSISADLSPAVPSETEARLPDD
jgi:DNA-binding CsgD family transcriptional regulator